MIVVFMVFTGITIYFVYYNWSLIKNNVSCIKFNSYKETETEIKKKKKKLKIKLIIFTMIL